MSRKQEIYQEMLRWGLPYIRDVLAQGAWARLKDRSALLEAQLLHSLPHSILDPDFTDNDLWFLNHHARAYLTEASPALCRNYDLHRKLIAELFLLVPPPRRAELKWNGPES
ncbi:MAG: zinc ABC transporter substrate-binding protein [Verrucomicrobiae bacterium]|nr:zinc ABC transporter substrate-binding protein [Verrucomicrobiae bacterium]